MDEYRNIMVMGAGGVGGYLGGRLAQHTSARLTFIARGAHLAAMRKEGLHIKSVEGDAVLQVTALQDPAGTENTPDLILFTVKSYDTQVAIEAIAPVVDEHTQIVTVQNGIENYPALVRAFGRERVIQGFCKIGAGIDAPGVIRHKALGEITVGEQGGATSPRLERMRRLFGEADIPVHITSEIDRKVWLKFSWNCIFNMVTAVADVTVEKLFEDDDTERLCYDIFEELREVAVKEGVPLTAADGRNLIEPARELEGFTTSTYQDRQKGKKLEYEAFTGAIVRLARKHQVEVPCNHTLYGMLKLVDCCS